ncbi:CW-type zinc finger family protein, putative [Babesia bigemina]|uniref:CW-type zinc finger family protein, putative n=1 Tax=Babesia bigemina TaxID=5866 RepID=A0A061D9A3_BABBI|nr:CW-type zinc finger family protein, putative [Babesia bigemina]CDR97266.1 CW-type zinc finger family protein, putative [Babesia bigemina]|eukprot:XP_012769452.1 CW-type zinc finger family protein, putative [Babesia bigemina]
MDLSKLAQPIPKQDAPPGPFEADGLAQLARKLDSVPLPSPSAVPVNGPGGEAPSTRPEYRTMSDAARAAMYPAAGGVNPKSKAVAPVKKAPGKLIGKLPSALAQAARATLAGRAESLSMSASLLTASALLAPIPDKLYDDDIPSPPVSGRTNSNGGRSAKPDVAADAAARRKAEAHAPPPTSPMKTRGSTRNTRQSRRAESKSSRSSRTAARQPSPVTTVENWAQCEKCKKWRRLPLSVDTEKLPDFWVCSLNVWDPAHNSCSVPEETFPDLKHHSQPATTPKAKVHASTGKKVTLPVRPVEPRPTSRGFNDRLMDHEVLELLFEKRSDHPLHKRLTVHSLGANSLLATELPHNVLLIDELPTAAALSVANDTSRPPSKLLHPAEELVKDDNVPRDDGTVSIGLARKTEWPTGDNDASTIDTVEEIDPGAEPPRSLLAAMFPKLALQVPKFGKFPPVKREELIRFEKSYNPDEHRPATSTSRSSGRAPPAVANAEVKTPNVVRSGRRSVSVMNAAIKTPGASPIDGKTPVTKATSATASTGKSPRAAHSGTKSASASASRASNAVASEAASAEHKGAALSSVSREDFRGLLSVFVNRKNKQPNGVARKHCLLEDKLRASTLPVESFLQPLSLLAMPIVYPTPEAPAEPAVKRSTRYSVRSAAMQASGVATSAPPEPAPVETKRESKRRMTTRSSRVTVPQSDRQLRRLREEYVRNSTGKSYVKKAKPSPPEPEVPAPATRRPVRRSTSRYARGAATPVAKPPEPEPVATQPTLSKKERMLMMELSIPIEHTAPVERRAASRGRSHRPMSSFGVDASKAMEMLTQPIDFVPDVKKAPGAASTTGSVPGVQPRMCTLDAPAMPALNLQLLSEPIPEFKPEPVEINVDVYKNPRLLTEV